MAEAARIAQRHGFVLRAVRHEGRLRIALVRPVGADATERPQPTEDGAPPAHPRSTLDGE
jgi:hypothetical protein